MSLARLAVAVLGLAFAVMVAGEFAAAVGNTRRRSASPSGGLFFIGLFVPSFLTDGL